MGWLATYTGMQPLAYIHMLTLHRLLAIIINYIDICMRTPSQFLPLQLQSDYNVTQSVVIHGSY